MGKLDRYLIQFQFKPYRRPFQRPLHTHHGVWAVREGVILRLTDATGQVGWGEIAPLKTFGSESLEQALGFCRSLPSEITAEMIRQIPSTLPACQFGFEAALEWMRNSLHFPTPHNRENQENSVLLPTGKAALEAWQTAYEQGATTFKWKISVAPLVEELQIFEGLIGQLPAEVKLRLDANGGLNWQAAYCWLKKCDDLNSSKLHRAAVEFVEQPLPPNHFDAMLQLSQQFQTPIALDESIATLSQLKSCYIQGWRGIFVVKAAIVGSPEQLRQFCQQHPVDIVWSSVFETAIARTFIQQLLVPSIDTTKRAIGFGVDQWFANSLFNQFDFEQLWQSL